MDALYTTDALYSQSSRVAVFLPLWFRHHWVLGSLNPGGTLDIWDSAPSTIIQSDIRDFASALSTRLGFPVSVKGRLIPRQPYASRQCGIHTVARALLCSLGLTSSLPLKAVVDLEPLRSLLPKTQDQATSFTALVLLAAARPEALHPFISQKKATSALKDSEVSSLLSGAQPNFRFLTARHTSKTSLPDAWEWGIASIRAHKRATTLLAWKPLINAVTNTTQDFQIPSASYFIFALTPLKPAPITWELSADEITSSQSLAPTLQIGSQTSSLSSEDAGQAYAPQAKPQITAPRPQAKQNQAKTAQSQSPRPRESQQPVHTTALHPASLEHETSITLLSPELLAAARSLPICLPDSLLGKDVVNLHVLSYAEARVPNLALRALAPSTANTHRQLLRSLHALDKDLWLVPLDQAILEWSCRLAARKHWKFSSLATRLASLAGAFRLLPLYTEGMPSIRMASSVIWGQAAKAAAHQQRIARPKRATPATWLQVKAIQTREGASSPALAILVAWLSCARIGDVLRLKPEDIVFKENHLQVTFKECKTRIPYTVSTTLPPQPFRTQLDDAIDSVPLTKRIFDTHPSAITLALKRQDMSLTQHSLRRGALQTLAAASVPSSALLHFSGHRTISSLMMYLDDGAKAPENVDRAVQARVLVGGSKPTDDSDLTLSLPSYHTLKKAFPSSTEEKVAHRAPLHLKKVRFMDLDALLELPMSANTKEYLQNALRWLSDEAPYNKALQEATKKAHTKFRHPLFTSEEMEQMRGIKYESWKGTSATTQFPVFGFPVSQIKPAGEVLRPVWSPAINAVIPDSALQQLHLPSQKEIAEKSVGTGDYLWCQLDARSCYDQFELKQPVKRFFCFLGEQKQICNLVALPMGFRPAVEISSAVLWALLDFPRSPYVTVTSHIDNVRFGGPQKEMAEAVIEFVRRAKACDYQLDASPMSFEEVKLLSPPVDTFLGIQFDYPQQTRNLPPKALKKLQLLHSITITPSKFQLASAVGLLTWCASILRFNWTSVWHLLRKYAISMTTWKPREKVMLSRAEFAELQVLLAFCEQNAPVEIAESACPQIDTLVVTDASSMGWGAIINHGAEGNDPKIVSERWAEEVQSSVTAEPEAAWRALQLISKKVPSAKHVMLLTDHLPLVFANRKGRAIAWSYNGFIARALSLPFKVSVGFIPGHKNPADAPSRGRAPSLEDLKIFKTLNSQLKDQGKHWLFHPSSRSFPDFMT